MRWIIYLYRVSVSVLVSYRILHANTSQVVAHIDVLLPIFEIPESTWAVFFRVFDFHCLMTTIKFRSRPLLRNEKALLLTQNKILYA